MVSVTGSCIDFTSAVLSPGTAQIRCQGSWTKVSSPSSSLTLSTPRCCWAPAHHRSCRQRGSIQLPQHDEGPLASSERWPSLDLIRTAQLPHALGIPEHATSSWQVLGGPLLPSSSPTADAQGMLLQQIQSIPTGSNPPPAVPRGAEVAEQP